MKKRILVGLGAIAASVAISAASAADKYNEQLYNTLLDCGALELLFAQSSDKDADKEEDKTNAAAFLSSATDMAGVTFDDVKQSLLDRMARITKQLDSSDGQAQVSKLTRSCAYIARVGKDAYAD